MRALNATLTELSQRSPIRVVPFVRMTTRDGTTYRFSDTDLSYLGDAYAPFLIRPSPMRETMNHLPASSFGQLYREFSFDLRNGTWDTITGRRLAPELRSHGLQFAQVVFGELWLDNVEASSFGQLLESDMVAALADSSHEEILFRGSVDVVGPITRELLSLACVSDVPRGGVDLSLIHI